MLLLTGNYTVTASAYGYLPKTVSGVSISQNATTTLNIGLTPAPTYVVSGTVRDALAGWPLYAKIDINGYPGGPIWTNPATGFYSVTLPAGVAYLFNVSAYSAGYTPSSVSVRAAERQHHRQHWFNRRRGGVRRSRLFARRHGGI